MTRCNRVWQAEAREDGRLDPQEVASFERHASGCSDCTIELEALGALARAMAALPSPPAPSDLEHRRLRGELQRRAHEQPSAPASPARWILVGALVAACALVGFFAVGRRRAPRFEVVDVARATWSFESAEGASVVRLAAGTAGFHVEHLTDKRRFLVSMPDGSIEVRGTRFVVEVVDGRTRKVEVTEGVVQLKVPGFEGTLRAGEQWPSTLAAGTPSATWSAAESAAASGPSSASPANPPSTAPSQAASAPAAAPPFVLAPSPSSSLVGPVASASAQVAGKNPAGPRFAEAMTAFSAGDFARADALFGAFGREFPGDARAEDALFLRARARARLGDVAGAAALAREYLARYPSGLRRPEAARLAGQE